MAESSYYEPLPMLRFILRVVWHVASAFLLLVISLIVGMVGYVRFEHLSWIDAFLNAAMLLGGMGPVNTPHTVVGKLFAGFYALYAGLVFIGVAALVIAPFLRRLLRHLRHREATQAGARPHG